MNQSLEIQNSVSQFFNNEIVICNSLSEFETNLAVFINNLINDDFEKLISLLYRIDISEQRLKVELNAKSNIDTGQIIASLIIERQYLKLQTRRSFSSGKNDIDEFEKW